MSDKYVEGMRLSCCEVLGTVVKNTKLPDDICVEWDTGQRSSYDETWLNEFAEKIEDE